MHQLLLPGVEQERVAHAALDDGQVEGAVDVVHRAEVVSLLDNAHVLLGGDDDDRNFVVYPPLLQDVQHAEAVELRHADIQQHQIDVGILGQLLQRLQAVARKQIVVIAA